MNFYKKFSVLFLVIFVLARNSLNAQQPAAASQPVCHFFPEGVIRATTPAQQWQEWARYTNATQNALANPNAKEFVSGSDEVMVEKEYFGQKVKIIFDQHIRSGDQIRYTSFNGQYFITKAQFDTCVNKIDGNIREAIEMDYLAWGELEPKAITIAAKSAGKNESDFRKELDKEDPLSPGITFRELRHIPPKLEKKDFVPFRELHSGLSPEIPTVLGVAWLNTGIVYYTPAAVIRDHLMGSIVILAHEFVHNNKKLQGIPLVWGFNAETFASIPAMLVDDDHLDLTNHGYAETFRELIWVYFGFDFERAKKEVVKSKLVGNLEIDEQKFNEYAQKQVIAKRELRKAMDKATAEFYSKPIWWTALNDKLQDNESVLKFIMATLYNPTLLGGEDATMKWYETNKPKIKQFSDEAWQESGSPAANIDPHLKICYLLFQKIRTSYQVSEKEAEEFMKFYKTSPKEICSWEPEKLKTNIEAYI